MGNIQLDIRLRPIRFAFLVRPDDKKRILEIFRINTCLWGGKYNPIIPFFKPIKISSKPNINKIDNVKQIFNDYFDFFEPDFIVEAEKGFADGLGFNPKRVIQLSDLLESDGQKIEQKYGLSVRELYKDLYKNEFQFIRKHKHNIIYVETEDKLFENFSACNFGCFPVQRQLEYFKRDYKEIFEPKKITLDSGSLSELYSSEYTSPQNISYHKLKVIYHGQKDPTLFILDANEPIDLIDLWNLRAVHPNVKAIPLQWIKYLSQYCKTFINYYNCILQKNLKKNHLFPKCIFSRSISESKFYNIEDIYLDHLYMNEKDSFCMPMKYHPIWYKTLKFFPRNLRPTLEANSKSLYTPFDNDKPKIGFDTLTPVFAEESGDRFGWANVVRMRDISNKGQVATVFPCNYKNPTFPKFLYRKRHLLPTTEGLVFFPENFNSFEQWDLIDGSNALNIWLNESMIFSEPSDSGKIAKQIINALDGLWGVDAIANKGIIELLNGKSKKNVSVSFNYVAFIDQIKKSIMVEKPKISEKKIKISSIYIFEYLVKCKAIELGLEIRCSKCSSWIWYSVKQIDYSLTCGFCLKMFDFPVTNPNNKKYSRWAYRVKGPFALPDYARGGYAVSLAVHFFTYATENWVESAVTWSSGQNMTLASKNKSKGDNIKLEADFILWYQRKQESGNDYTTDIVFGEAKSFSKDAFKKKDINNMKILAKSFPGAIFVFAVMKEAKNLSYREISRLKKFALWGREYNKELRQSRSPVIILTGTELFSLGELKYTWDSIGGRHKKLINATLGSTNNLRVLADLTQQLYLDMPSYEEWHADKQNISKKFKQK